MRCLARFFVTLTLALAVTGCSQKKEAALAAPEKPAGEMYRFQWLLANSAGDYLKVGNRDARWDILVLQALTNQSRARMGLDNGNWWDGILKASEAGCTDPLVGYWQVRAKFGDADRATMDNLSSWTNAASALIQSSYSPYRKYYACLRALEAMRANRKSTQAGTTEHTNSNIAWNIYLTAADKNAAAVAADPQAPAEEVLVMVEDFLSATEWATATVRYFVDAVEPALLRGHPTAPQTEHILGHFALVRAWLARGNDYASKTSDPQFRALEKGLEQAEALLQKAWKTHPRVETAIQMIRVQLGRGSQSQMDHWFQQAMALQPNSYAAVRAKYYYLEPKWHGSRAEQHAFAMECVASTNWGGHVPQIMLDYYSDLAADDPTATTNLYARPAVWADLRAALEKLLKLNPQKSGWHYNFFKFAYLASDWPVAARELHALGDVLDFTYFGGEEQFRTMTNTVRAKMAAVEHKL